MSKSYNNAGKSITVDRVRELLGGTGASSRIGSMIQKTQQVSGSDQADRFSRLQMEIVGDRAIGRGSQTFVVQVYEDGVLQTALPSLDFRWTRPDHADGWTVVDGRVLTLDADDIVEAPETFICTWRYENEVGVIREKAASMSVSYATITQYQWSNAADESDLNKDDSAWSDVKPVQPDGIDYLWERRSDDNGVTWLYFRNTGLIGPQGPQGPMGWSSYTAQLYRRSDTAPEPFDGGTLTFTFSTRTLTGDKGSWSDTIPAGDGTLWVIYGSFLSQSDTDTIQPNEWTSPAQISTEGTQGESGLSVATMFIYQRAEEKPPLPTADATYSFTSGILSGVSPWSAYVPSGSGRCWISTATISTRTDSAVIPPSKWSEPEIFIEPAEPGVGIESTTTEYALSDSRYTAPETGWSTLYPEKEDGQYIWTRITVTYTDGTSDIVGLTCSTGDQGPQGPAGQTTGVIIKYAYGHSYLEPPKGGLYWALERKLMFRDGKISGLPPQAWTRVDRPRPSTGEWYLWVKWSTDGGKTYCQPKLMSGEGTKSIEIVASAESYRMSSRGTVTTEQQIAFHVKMQNLSGIPTWTIPAFQPDDDHALESAYQIVLEDLDGNKAVEKDGNLTIVSEYVLVRILQGCRIQGFIITASFAGSYSDEMPIEAIVPEYVPSYLGKYDEPPLETDSGEPLMIGDHYYDLSDGRAYEWALDSSGKAGWRLVTGDSELYSIIAGHMLGDALMYPVNDDDNLTIANIWTDTIAFNNGFGRKFASTDYQLMENEETGEPGKIRSYGFTEDQFGKVPGVLIDALGNALLSMARMMNVEIATYSDDGRQIILMTMQEQVVNEDKSAADLDMDYISGQQIIDAYLDYGRQNNSVDDEGNQDIYGVVYRPWGSEDFVKAATPLSKDGPGVALFTVGGIWIDTHTYTLGAVRFDYTLTIEAGAGWFGNKTGATVTVINGDVRNVVIDVASTTSSYSRTYSGKAGDMLEIRLYRQSAVFCGAPRALLKPTSMSGDCLLCSYAYRAQSGLATMTVFGYSAPIDLYVTGDDYIRQDVDGYYGLPVSSEDGSVWSYMDNTPYYIDQVELRAFFSGVEDGNRLCSADSWIQFDDDEGQRYFLQSVQKDSQYARINYFMGGVLETYILDLVRSDTRGFDDRKVEVYIEFLSLPSSIVTATLIPSMISTPDEDGRVIESDIGMSDRRYRNVYSMTVDTNNLIAQKANLKGLPTATDTAGLQDGDLYDDNGTVRIYHP